MSEYETTDLGGDPVEFKFVEGGTYERGVIRSTADHQQIQRDAERTIEVANHHSYYQISDRIATTREVDLARYCLALLDDLERAELDRDEWNASALTDLHKRLDAERQRDDAMAWLENEEDAAWAENERALKAEARLARVPALVEAAKRMRITCSWPEIQQEWDDALAAWDNQ